MTASPATPASAVAHTPTTSTGDWCIDLHDVSKVYKGKVRALNGIAMQVGRGEIFGLLGPNGAGKSTLVKIIMTIVNPSQAKGTVLGHRLGHRSTLARVGYLPEDHRFPAYLTGRQVLHYYGALAGVGSVKERRRRSSRLLDLVAMERWADRPVRQYSKGMMQRIGLAQALMNDPDLVLLDEPTDGVDPVGRREIREMLRQIRDEGRTIFLNSHLLSEVEMLCSRVAILVQGTVRTIGSIHDLTRDSRRIEIEISAKQAPAWLAGEFPQVTLRTIAGAAPPVTVSAGGHGSPATPPIPTTRAPAADSVAGEHRAATADGPTGLVLVWTGATTTEVQPLIDRLRGSGIEIRRVQPLADTLEDLFVSMVQNDDPGAGAGPSRRRRSGGAGKVEPVRAA